LEPINEHSSKSVRSHIDRNGCQRERRPAAEHGIIKHDRHQWVLSTITPQVDIGEENGDWVFTDRIELNMPTVSVRLTEEEKKELLKYGGL